MWKKRSFKMGGLPMSIVLKTLLFSKVTNECRLVVAYKYFPVFVVCFATVVKNSVVNSPGIYSSSHPSLG